MKKPPSYTIEHVCGMPWWAVPLPRRRHRCRAQTTGTLVSGKVIERCACGAIRYEQRRWFHKNQRRKRFGGRFRR